MTGNVKSGEGDRESLGLLYFGANVGEYGLQLGIQIEMKSQYPVPIEGWDSP